MELSLIHKNLKLAQKIVKFCQAQVKELPDNLSSDNMTNYVTAMIQEHNIDEAFQGIVFMNELQITEGIVEVALEAAQKLHGSLSLTQKQTLNNMFSSSSKWVMLWNWNINRVVICIQAQIWGKNQLYIQKFLRNWNLRKMNFIKYEILKM